MINLAAAKLLQSCPTLCNSIDGSPSGSPVPGIFQARTLEWVAIFFSNAWKWKLKVKSLSRVRLFATPWSAVYQAPPSMGFSRQEYWSGVPSPSPIINLDSILKNRDITLPTKVHLVKAMVFPLVMYGCESWTIKKAELWSIWTVVLEKTLESPLAWKEIKPVNPKDNPSWIFIGRTDTAAEAPILWPPDTKSQIPYIYKFLRKYPDAGKEWGQEE